MRITFLIPVSNLSGGVKVAAIHAERLQRRGHEVTMIARPFRRPSLAQKLLSLARARRWPRNETASPYFAAVGFRHLVLDRPRPIVDEDVPDGDVVIATWWETAFEVAALSPAKGRKFYFVQHHEVHDHLPRHLSAGSYWLPLKKIAISRWLVDIMRDRYGDSDVAFVPNSVDTAQFHAPARGKAARPTVGFVFSNTPFKGADIALAALSKLRERFPDLRVVAFGAEAPKAARRLPEWVEFTRRPAQDAIRALYATCDVWLCPSWAEGFYLPLLEAMACRCPVVSTRVGGPIDVVEDGVQGHLADVGDVDGLAAGLERVLSLPAPEWRSMSDAALATATAYSWDDAAERFEAVLLGAAGKPFAQT